MASAPVNRFWPAAVSAMAFVALMGILGCRRGGPQTFPVKGKVELPGGNVSHLAGSHVEAILASDPKVRASGEIQQDGSFRLETLHNGRILPGAREGNYQVRIVLTDEDSASNRRAAKTIAPRFLSSTTSGLSLQVPPPGEVTLKVSQR